MTACQKKTPSILGVLGTRPFFPTEKTILFVCETREEAMEIEIELHDFFDVAVNPKFANQAKQTSTNFDTTGVIFGPRTEETKKKLSEQKIGERNPMYGVPRNEEDKKKIKEGMAGRFIGALSPCSKAIIAIEPDGTQRHFGGINEAARELEIPRSNLYKYLKPGKQQKQGKWKGWQFLSKNLENF